MISYFNASLEHLSIHHTGNKLLEEYYSLSSQPLAISDELLGSLLTQFFLKPFEKVNEVFRLHHHNGSLELNEVYHFVKEVFDKEDLFHQSSQELAKHLYQVANHPKIKSGELYVAYLKNVQLEGEELDAIGIFKSETKDTYLKVYPEKDGFGMSYEQDAISINKLDKGCLIFNTDATEGFKVLVVDQSKAHNDSAVYWKDEFLMLKIRNDSFHQTNNVLGVYKSFVTQKLDDDFEISKADKIDLLNKSMKYFKEKDTFDIDEFSSEVIGNDNAIASFKTYKKNYEEEFDAPIPDSFDIADAAVKKQARVFKSVLKLDKNFHIYIHGNKDMLEKGFDEDRSMNFYKVYFKDEE
ncbi:nucleoid-associated protein [Pedobacter panaciterrae]